MKRLLLIALLLSVFSSYSYAQVKTTVKAPQFGYVEVSGFGGMITPMGEFGNNFLASARTGIDIGYRVNKEVTLYSSFGYSSLRSNNEAPSSSLIAIVVGPRYMFTNPKLKSNIFAEGGVGAFIQNTDSYVMNNLQTVEKVSNTNVGFNAGLGGMLALSNTVDIFVRSKYNLIFQTGGSVGYIGTDAGFTVKFN